MCRHILEEAKHRLIALKFTKSKFSLKTDRCPFVKFCNPVLCGLFSTVTLRQVTGRDLVSPGWGCLRERLKVDVGAFEYCQMRKIGSDCYFLTSSHFLNMFIPEFGEIWVKKFHSKLFNMRLSCGFGCK